MAGLTYKRNTNKNMAKLTSKRKVNKELSVEEQEKALAELKKKGGKKKAYNRVTIDFPPDVYDEMKSMVKAEGFTLKGYIIKLVLKDMKSREE